jgi:hypothetical protein
MATFERDIIFADDDGQVFHITQEMLAKLHKEGGIEEVNLQDSRYARVKMLLENGVAAAAIPTPDNAHLKPDAFCFLVNLGALAKHQPLEPGEKQAGGGQSASPGAAG